MSLAKACPGVDKNVMADAWVAIIPKPMVQGLTFFEPLNNSLAVALFLVL
jgi:hypothetical protein